MSLNYYKLYIAQVLDLSKTMVIKVDAVAESINERLKNTHANSFDPEDKHTWKYYLNLSGQYHSTDQKIYVTSLDTLQNIEFNRDNLLIHRATAQAYEYGSRYYRELISQHPGHEQFILGALYPIDINKAINADDFTVLGYPGKLIEDNEVSLIENINKWLYGFKERWYNKQFLLTDTNYISAFLAVMFLQLPSLIVTLRLRACRTSEAHTFHIREYLESHGMLDVYLSNMTRKQALFFYRNINYIERNSGKAEIFDWLIEKVMSDRNLPLSEFNMRHDIAAMPEEYTPKAMFKKRLLNESARIYENDEGIYSLAYILSKEEPEAVGNSEYRANNEAVIRKKFENSRTNTYKTKVLESAMFDYSDASPITTAEVALNNWLYLSQNNKYNIYIPITNPVTGVSMTVDVKTAFIVFLHAYNKANGIKVTAIPPLVATRVPIDPVPTRDEVYSLVDHNLIPIEYVDYILDLHKPLETITSVSAFKDWVAGHQKAAMEQMYFVSNQEHLYTRGLMHNAVSRLYQVAEIRNELTGQNFETILSFNNIQTDGLGTVEWTRLYTEIYKSATGFELNATSAVGDLQKAMISLMRQLSSYSIQFVQSINSSSIKVINWAAIRLGDVKYTGRALYQVQIALMRIFKLLIKNNPQFKINLPSLLQNFTLRTPIRVNPIEIELDLMGEVKLSSKKLVDLGAFKLNQAIGPYCAGSDLRDVPLYQAYYNLTPEQQAEVKDIYTNYVTPDNYIPKVDIDTIAKTTKVGINVVKPRLSIMDAYVHYYAAKNYNSFYNDDIKVVLDGFYSNIGDAFVTNHKAHAGYYKATSFKYVNGLPEDIMTPGEEYSGGYVLANLYSIKKTGDIDLTLEPLSWIDETGAINFNPIYLNYDVPFQWYNYAHATFNFEYFTASGLINTFKFASLNMDAGKLVALSGDKDLPIVPTFLQFVAQRTPTPYNPDGSYAYVTFNYDATFALQVGLGNFTLGAMSYSYEDKDLEIISGGGNVNLDNVTFYRIEYNVSQTFGTQFIDKTINNNNVISHRTIPQFIFVYVNSSVDTSEWKTVVFP